MRRLLLSLLRPFVLQIVREEVEAYVAADLPVDLALRSPKWTEEYRVWMEQRRRREADISVNGRQDDLSGDRR